MSAQAGGGGDDDEARCGRAREPPDDKPVRDFDLYSYTAHFDGSAGDFVAKLASHAQLIDWPNPKHNYRTPMHAAALKGRLDVIEGLLAAGSRSFDVPDIHGWTPLRLAAKNGHVGVIDRLLAAGSQSIDTPSESGWTPLHLAAQGGHVSVIEVLLRCGSRALDTPENDGRSPLLVGACNGHASVVEALLQAGSQSIDAADRRGWTPLFAAARAGSQDAVDLLLAAGASRSIPPSLFVSEVMPDWMASKLLEPLDDQHARDIRCRVYFAPRWLCAALLRRLAQLEHSDAAALRPPVVLPPADERTKATRKKKAAAAAAAAAAALVANNGRTVQAATLTTGKRTGVQAGQKGATTAHFDTTKTVSAMRTGDNYQQQHSEAGALLALLASGADGGTTTKKKKKRKKKKKNKKKTSPPPQQQQAVVDASPSLFEQPYFVDASLLAVARPGGDADVGRLRALLPDGKRAADSGHDGSTVVHAWGLPWRVTPGEIRQFFDGLPLHSDDSIVIEVDDQGRRTGDAYVRFADAAVARSALSRHCKYMGHRYVCVELDSLERLLHAQRLATAAAGDDDALPLRLDDSSARNRAAAAKAPAPPSARASSHYTPFFSPLAADVGYGLLSLRDGDTPWLSTPIDIPSSSSSTSTAAMAMAMATATGGGAASALASLRDPSRSASPPLPPVAHPEPIGRSWGQPGAERQRPAVDASPFDFNPLASRLQFVPPADHQHTSSSSSITSPWSIGW